MNIPYLLFCFVIIASCLPKTQNISVQTSQRKLPVLTGKDANEVLKIMIIKKYSHLL